MAGSYEWVNLSVGVSGNWNVIIDEPVDSDEVFFSVFFEHPVIYIRFYITSLSVINSLIDFLDNMKSINNRFEIEGGSEASLEFEFDEGQLFLWIHSPGILGKVNVFRVWIDDDDTESLPKALKDAVESA